MRSLSLSLSLSLSRMSFTILSPLLSGPADNGSIFFTSSRYRLGDVGGGSVRVCGDSVRGFGRGAREEEDNGGGGPAYRCPGERYPSALQGARGECVRVGGAGPIAKGTAAGRSRSSIPIGGRRGGPSSPFHAFGAGRLIISAFERLFGRSYSRGAEGPAEDGPLTLAW